MTPLAARLGRQIAAAGPISIADYMATCLFDPEHGYYTTRQPFGAAGDFTTAPEISQMFGESVAVRVWLAWEAMGRPAPFGLVEIGPGRGTLMADMLRTLARLDGGLMAGLDVAMIEASPRLRDVQRETLRDAPRPITWHQRIDETPPLPAAIVANELFDAVPIRQFVKTPAGWRERMVASDAAGNLAFVVGAAGIDPSLLPEGAGAVPIGAIVEVSPAREAMMQTICERIVRHDGFALLVDYGYTVPPFGDTLQAVRDHAFDDVLAHPGEADLTTHVDFAALVRVARRAGLSAGIVTQGEFLLAAGLLERAGALGAGKDAATQERLRGEAERLAGPEAMGTLFKVLTVCRPDHTPLPDAKPMTA